MRTLCTSVLAILLIVIGLPAFALPSFNAEYTVSKGIITVGVLTRRLHIENGTRYTFESRMETTGLVALFSKRTVVETSRGRIEATKFIPEQYHYDKGDKRRDYELIFDHAAHLVSRRNAGQESAIALPPGLLDKLVYQAQMIVDVAADPPTLGYAIAERNDINQYVITNLGREDIVVAARDFVTTKMQRLRPNSQKRTTVWFAKALDWMPVKVEYRDRHGSVTTAELRALNGKALR